jgi:hypothetical protein
MTLLLTASFLYIFIGVLYFYPLYRKGDSFMEVLRLCVGVITWIVLLAIAVGIRMCERKNREGI